MTRISSFASSYKKWGKFLFLKKNCCQATNLKRHGDKAWAYERVITAWPWKVITVCVQDKRVVVLVLVFSVGCTNPFIAQLTVVREQWFSNILDHSTAEESPHRSSIASHFPQGFLLFCKDSLLQYWCT